MNQISELELQQRLSKVKLLTLDVDGVLTDGGLYYTESGEELKKFNVKDGMGLKLLMQAGIEIAIITTSSSSSVLHRAKKLGISHVFLGIEEKLPTLEFLCEKLNITFEQVAYVGDDINDIPILEKVACPFTVADAMNQNKNMAIYITKSIGGNGAVREICDLIVESISSINLP
jgi:3-deoxy-D-manno-octulosonate 8-phosphate phosphatase (KDO 8-P phosphatase)